MTMIRFKLTFADENGLLHHEEIEGEQGFCFAWLQGYLSGGNYMLMKISAKEANE